MKAAVSGAFLRRLALMCIFRPAVAPTAVSTGVAELRNDDDVKRRVLVGAKLGQTPSLATMLMECCLMLAWITLKHVPMRAY